MVRPVIDVLVNVASAVVEVLILALLAWTLSKTRYPRLEEPDPAFVPTAKDRKRNVFGVCLSLAIGAFVGYRLWVIPAAEIPGALAQRSAYDGAGRFLGAFFAALGFAARVAYPIAARLVRPQTLQHFLWKSAEQFRRLDPRPLTKTTGNIAIALGLLLQLGLRDSYIALVDDGIVWRDAPWEAEETRPWRDVASIYRVGSFEAPTGKVVERDLLSIYFEGGDSITVGRWAEWKRGELDPFLAIVEQKSGKKARIVPR